MTVFPHPKAPGIAVVPPCTQLDRAELQRALHKHKGQRFIFLDSREKSIQNSLSGQQWMVRRELLRDWPDLPHWPHLHHGELLLHTFKLQLQHHILNITQSQMELDWTLMSHSSRLCPDTHRNVIVSRRSHVGDSASVARGQQ